MNVVTILRHRFSLLAGRTEYTLVSGPHGPLRGDTPRLRVNPRRDHSDRAQSSFMAESRYSLAATVLCQENRLNSDVQPPKYCQQAVSTKPRYSAA